MTISEFDWRSWMQRNHPESKLKIYQPKEKCSLFIQNRSDRIRRRKQSFELRPWETASSKVQLNKKIVFFVILNFDPAKRNHRQPTTIPSRMYASNSRSKNIWKTKNKIFQCQSSIFNIHTNGCIHRVREYDTYMKLYRFACCILYMYSMCAQCCVFNAGP